MRPVLVLAVILLGICVAGLLLQPSAMSAPEKAAGPKWDYRVPKKDELLDRGSRDLAAELNKLGEEGWELVAVEPQVNHDPRGGQNYKSAELYFKRPKK